MAKQTYQFRPTPDSPEYEMLPVEIEKSEESWVKLFLEDGTVLKVKIIVSKVGRSVNRPIPGRNGEPLYHIESGTVVVAEVPDKLRFKGEE
jgi:hypothetical protein